MAAKKKTFEVSGAQPVIVAGTRRFPGEVFEAHAKDVAYFETIGAVKPSQKSVDKD